MSSWIKTPYFPRVTVRDDAQRRAERLLAGWLLRVWFLVRRLRNSPVDSAYPVDSVPQGCPNPPDKPFPPE
jgi:hypothetical protein